MSNTNMIHPLIQVQPTDHIRAVHTVILTPTTPPPHALRSPDASVAALSLPAVTPRRFSLSSYWRSWARKPSLGQMAGLRDCTKFSACSYVMASADVDADGVLLLATGAGCVVGRAAVALWERETAENDGGVVLLASGGVASESGEEEAGSVTEAVGSASPPPSASVASSRSGCSACRCKEESGWAP